MAEKINSTVRIVKCPRCRGVLQEPTGVPVYECGGCGAKLQAKKRVDTSLQRPDENASGKQKVDQVFVDQEAASSSNQQPMLNSTNESDQTNDHNDLHSSHKDQYAVKLVNEPDQRSLVNPSNEPDQNVHYDPRTSTEYSGHVDPESSPEATTHNITDQQQQQDQSQNTQLSLVNSMNELDRDNEHNKHHISSKLLYHEDLEPSPEPTVHDRVKQYETKFIHSSNKDLDAAAKLAETITFHVPNQQSLVNSSDEPDQNVHNDPRTSTEYSSHEDHYEAPESSPEATVDQVKLHETEIEEPVANTDGHNRSKPSFGTLILPEQEQNQKQAENEPQKTEQLSDDNESVESGNRSTQLLLTNSMNHNKHSYHEDIDSSSPEATLHNRFKNKHKLKQHETEFVSFRTETEESIANSSFRSIIADKLLDTKQKKPLYLDEDDFLSESKTGTADLRHRRRLGRRRHGGDAYDGSVSSFDGNDNLNPRKHRISSIRDEYVDSGRNDRFNRRIDTHRSRNVRSIHDLKYRSPMIPENPRSERIELLKLVRELQEQLERTNVTNLQHGGFRRGYGERTAFSGDVTSASRCRHCYPKNGCFSAQLHDCCYRPNSYHSLRFSSPLSPKQAQVQTQAQGQYSGFDGQWQRNEVRKPFVSPNKKRYVRPIAGGSPWIACYLCSKLLQLPESFLVSDKSYHSLRCGACLKVLKFTVLEGTRVSRYYPEEMIAAPPSSEVDGPVSCSDRSFEKSYSTETDRYGSREFGEERGKGVLVRDTSGSTRAKVSGKRTGKSEIEEVGPRRNGSPLHWLMGYASPSKVIRGL